VACPAIPQEYPRFFDLRSDLVFGAGPARIATASGTRTLPVLGIQLGLSSVAAPWSAGTTLRGWFSDGPDVNGGGGQLLLRGARLLSVSGLEVHAGLGIGATYLADNGLASRRGTESRFGPAYEAGLTQEIELGRRLGVLVALDVVGQPTGGSDPRLRSPMVLLGLGLRHHSFDDRGSEPERDPTKGTYRRRPRRYPRPLPWRMTDGNGPFRGDVQADSSVILVSAR
jgi:hypothetical protein